MNKGITRIPFPDGSNRIETGAIQFRDDWPGLFVRGDTAIPVGVAIRDLQRRLGVHSDPAIRDALHLLDEIATIVEEGVWLR
jgi:hypothetical protein